MVEHIVMITDPATGDMWQCHQRGYNSQDVEHRVSEALAPGSGGVYEGMVAIIDPLPVASH